MHFSGHWQNKFLRRLLNSFCCYELHHHLITINLIQKPPWMPMTRQWLNYDSHESWVFMFASDADLFSLLFVITKTLVGINIGLISPWRFIPETLSFVSLLSCELQVFLILKCLRTADFESCTVYIIADVIDTCFGGFLHNSHSLSVIKFCFNLANVLYVVCSVH